MRTADAPSALSVHEVDAESGAHAAEDLGVLRAIGDATFRARRGRTSLWVVASLGGRDVAALRLGDGVQDLEGPVTRAEAADAIVFEFGSQLGAFRTKIAFPADGRPIVRCTTSFLPTQRRRRTLLAARPPRPRIAGRNDPHRTTRASQRHRLCERGRSGAVHAVLLSELLFADGLLRGDEAFAIRDGGRPLARARLCAAVGRGLRASERP